MSSTRTAESIAITLCRAILLAVMVGSLGFAVYAVSAQKSHILVRIIPALVGIITPPLLLRLKPVNLLLATSIWVGAGLGLYAAQLFALVLTDPDRPALQDMEIAAKQEGLPFDGRTRIQAILDFRSQGIEAYPPFYPYLLLSSPLRIDGKPTVALGSMANAFTVCCNESGPYLTYTTDEHGFPNPRGSWSRGPQDLVLIGASTAVGESVPPADGLPALLRARYPRTVVVAAGGDGPLLELASIREYLPALKPKKVLWIFSESHTPEYLENESHSPALRAYLDPSHRQGLIERQESVNRAVAQYFADGISTVLAERSWITGLKRFLLLSNIRTLIYYFVTDRTQKPKPFELNGELYEQVLKQGMADIAAWEGTMALVYWPDSSRYAGICNYTPELRSVYERTHNSVLNTAAKLKVPVIDLARAFPDLPASEASINMRYFYPYPAHFKPAGYHRAAEAILSSLEPVQ